MLLPEMKYADGIAKSKQVKFGGLNRTASAGDGELADMKNMTSDHSPVLAVREKRHLLKTLALPGGIYCWDKLCWVDGTTFFYDGEAKGQVSEGEKSFASLGKWIVILPDQCCYNVSTGEFKSLGAAWYGSSLTFGNGLRYGETATANAISCTGVSWDDYFNAGDAVEISGCEAHPENNISAIIREIDGSKLYFSENIFQLAGDEGTLSYTESGQLSICRKVPQLRYICEHENRLWGCSEDTIYASKPGDVFNWYAYDGLESDAWALTPASMGVFTGVISYRGYVTFFKEDHIYKVYGSVPSNFEVMGSATLGLKEGCYKSLAIAGETLFYLGRNGITAYTGGIPQPMGQELGTERFLAAVAGSDGLKYYLSLQNAAGHWWIYVYDTQRGVWHKEDEIRALGFAGMGGTLYCLTDSGEIWAMGPLQDPPEDSTEETQVEWAAEFSDFTENDPNHKGVSKLQIRLELAEEANVCVLIQFDSDGEWHHVRSITGQAKKRSYYLPITPRRCDHYRLKLTGAGPCKVHSLVRESYSGSEYNTWR